MFPIAALAQWGEEKERKRKSHKSPQPFFAFPSFTTVAVLISQHTNLHPVYTCFTGLLLPPVLTAAMMMEERPTIHLPPFTLNR